MNRDFKTVEQSFANRKQRRHAVAQKRAQFRRKLNEAKTHNDLGLVLHKQGKLDDAAAAFARAMSLKPDCAEAHNHLGHVLLAQGKLDQAIAAYRRGLELEPNHEVYVSLGNALFAQGKTEEAEECCRQALALKPDFAGAHNNLGNLLWMQGQFAEAMACYRTALSLMPDYADGHHNLGMVLCAMGDFAEAAQHFEVAIALAPRNPAYYRMLGTCRSLRPGDPYVAAMEEMGRDLATLSPQQRIDLHFALAKVYAGQNNHRRSFEHLLSGNAEKRAQIRYDEAAQAAFFERIEQVFTEALMRQKESLRGDQRSNDGRPVPIFIVGMPRSGTTLVEQILASHPLIFGASELETLKQTVQRVRRPDGKPVPYAEFVPAVDSGTLAQLGAYYLAQLRRLAPNAQYVTDKMPLNFFFVGLIHLALPHARIIHTVRDPIDTCLSCFSTLFRQGQDFSYDLAELGRYYRCYKRLMDHWRNVLPPGRILDVRYEDVVSDLEGQARRMLSHCGLDWDARCLSFHQTARPVRTASVTQVRQPIYQSSIGRWRAYEEFLQPLLSALGVRELAV